MNVEVKKSGIEGTGLFAAKKISEGKTAIILKGKKVIFYSKNEADAQEGANWLGIGKNEWLEVSSPGVYLNHCCEPNCGIKGARTIVALREIQCGEEVTIDYSITESDPFWEMKCNCGSKKCRGTIRSIQSLPREILNKYLPYVPTYFKKLYSKI